MQIKVIPDVPGNEQAQFKLDWARAIAGAEEALSQSIISHLENLIQNIDQNVLEKIRKTLELLTKHNTGGMDPMHKIRQILTDVNKERFRVNNKQKRKRDKEDQEDADIHDTPNNLRKKRTKSNNFIN